MYIEQFSQQESLRSKDIEELEKMNSKMHSLLRSERKVLEELVHSDISKLSSDEQGRHYNKVSIITS